MTLDLSPLEKAIAQLSKGIEYLRSQVAQQDAELHVQLRTAVIKEFEFTYEPCFKLVRRYLEQNTPSPEVIRELPVLDLMRHAADAGLVRDPVVFGTYRERRNITAHTYDETKAKQVVAIAGDFLADACFVLAALQKRNHGER